MANKQAIQSRVPLIIAAHGTRNADGVSQTKALVKQLSDQLPGVHVGLGFVELAQPDIAAAVTEALPHIPEVEEGEPELIVVPLMLNTGGHVTRDIPGAIEQGRAGHRVGYGSPLMPDPRLRKVLENRVQDQLAGQAAGDVSFTEPWRADDTTVVVVGRGTLSPQANSEHYRLTRMMGEELGAVQAIPAFIQVTRPSIPEALNQAVAAGARQIVVAPVFLFHGRLRTWTRQQVEAWQLAHDDIPVRIADIIGPAPELVDVLADRYREQCGNVGEAQGAPVYLSGLRLEGRKVLVVGAGYVAGRRIPQLLAAGAQVQMVAPNAGIKAGQFASAGAVSWQQRIYQSSDMDDAWYVLAATNDPQINARIAAEAQSRHIFCVRSDDARQGSAYTPAVDQAGGITVAVIGDRNPRRSVGVRDHLLAALQS